MVVLLGSKSSRRTLIAAPQDPRYLTTIPRRNPSLDHTTPSIHSAFLFQPPLRVHSHHRLLLNVRLTVLWRWATKEQDCRTMNAVIIFRRAHLPQTCLNDHSFPHDLTFRISHRLFSLNSFFRHYPPSATYARSQSRSCSSVAPRRLSHDTTMETS